MPNSHTDPETAQTTAQTGGDGNRAAPTLRRHDDPLAIDAAAWNALLAASPNPTPFLRHEFLAALHRSGCASARTGWTSL